MIHELKIQSEYFEVVNNKTKTFEIRKNDRNFKVGDKILLREIDSCGRYTGGISWWKITYMTDYAQQEGYVVMAIEELEETVCQHLTTTQTKPTTSTAHANTLE